MKPWTPAGLAYLQPSPPPGKHRAHTVACSEQRVGAAQVTITLTLEFEGPSVYSFDLKFGCSPRLDRVNGCIMASLFAAAGLKPDAAVGLQGLVEALQGVPLEVELGEGLWEVTGYNFLLTAGQWPEAPPCP